MTIREQIITVKVTWDDLEEDGCLPQDVEGCCGEACENTVPSAATKVVETMECCGGCRKVEVLQSTEPREVLSQSTFNS